MKKITCWPVSAWKWTKTATWSQPYLISDAFLSWVMFLILKQLHDTAICHTSDIRVMYVCGMQGCYVTDCDLISCPPRRWYILNGRSHSGHR